MNKFLCEREGFTMMAAKVMKGFQRRKKIDKINNSNAGIAKW